MTTAMGLIIAGVVVVLVFDYTTGLQDAANLLSTIAASRTTTQVQAAILIPTFAFLGPILGGIAVANTIGKFVDVTSMGLSFVMETLMRKEAYRHLSNASDNLAHAGDVLHDIVVKTT